MRSAAFVATGSVFSLEPGWVYPSITAASLTGGSGVAGVIVWTPAPGMSKAIVSAPR